MEQEELVYLDAGAQEAYMAFQRKFESDDWIQTVAWAKTQIESVKERELSAKSWDQVIFNRGARSSYEDIVNLEASVENQFKELVHEAQAKQIAEEEQEHE